ncbi:MAG: zf-HC2 domain-containing protein [Longimicrobiales bacterium]|nr:zf-HC2 domain-containing protein [Longimicrobiales bacterium]
MRHPDESRLNDYADGLLAPGEAAAVEGHLDGCPDCRERVTSIRELTTALADLPRGIPPRRDLRPARDVVAERPSGRASSPAWRAWLRTAAVLAALVGSGLALWHLLPGPELPGPADPVVRSYARAAEDLEATVRARGTELSPDAAGALATGLETVDAAIRELEAHGPTEDGAVDRLLEARYRTKIDLLRDALALLEGS